MPAVLIESGMGVLTVGSEANSQPKLLPRTVRVVWGTSLGGCREKTHRPEYESENKLMTHNNVLWHASLKRVGRMRGSMQHKTLTANSKHPCTQQAHQTAAQHNKSKPPPAQPRQAEQKLSQDMPSQLASMPASSTKLKANTEKQKHC